MGIRFPSFELLLIASVVLPFLFCRWKQFRFFCPFRVLKPLQIIIDELKSMQITLSQGYTAIVSPEDYELLAPFKWHAAKCSKKVYAARGKVIGGKSVRIYMHRQIMVAEASHDLFVDHINGNSLDNRRANLRLVTPSQNTQNIQRVNSSSGFFGVYPQRGAFVVRVAHEKEQHYVGVFESPIEAAFYANQKLDELRPGFGIRNQIDYPQLIQILTSRKQAIEEQLNAVLKASKA